MSRKRLLLHGSNAIISVLVIIAIVVFANYFAKQYGGRADLTREKLFSISDKTEKILETLNTDVEVIGFFKELGLDRKQFAGLIGQYEKKSDKIKVKFVDPDKSPGLAKQYGVTEYSTVVLVSGDQNLKIKLSDPLSEGIIKTSEQELTNGIIKLTKSKKKTLYFVSGHGERDVNDTQDVSNLGKLRLIVQDEGYEVADLIIKQNLDLPVSDSILVIAAPKKPLLDAELNAIRKFINDGGKTVFFLEPQGSQQIVSLLSDYGFIIGNNIVIDPSSKLVGGGDVAPIVAQYPPHKITENFKFATLFPFVRTVDVPEGDVNLKPIAYTSKYSWAETNLQQFDQGSAEYNEGADKMGPLSIAAVGTLDGGGKTAVFGSVDFVSNRFLEFSGNKDLILNTINWVSGDEDLISIRPKVAEQGKFVLTSGQYRAFFISTVVIIPLILIGLGIYVWFKRKNM